MQLVSLNVGLPREVDFQGKKVLTGIFKSPVNKRLKISFLNIEGDKQADLSVHGGRDKAVYAYASEYYEFWKSEFPGKDLPFGMFGENLTISGGLFETEIKIGDIFSLGTSELMAVQPRIPCFKLGIRFGDPSIIKKFMKAGKSGVYFRVLKEGETGPNDTLEKIKESPFNVSVYDVFTLFDKNHGNKELLEKVIEADDLADNLKSYFKQVLGKLKK